MHRRSVGKRHLQSSLEVDSSFDIRTDEDRSTRRLVRKQRRRASVETHPIMWVLAFPLIFLGYKLIIAVLEHSNDNIGHPGTVRTTSYVDETSEEQLHAPQSDDEHNDEQTRSSHHHQISIERRVPLVVQLGSSTNTTFQQVSHSQHDTIGPYEYLDDHWDGESCVPMHKWQLFNPLSCNKLHEIDLPMRIDNNQLYVVNCGDSRCAFRMQDDIGEELALKLVLFSQDEEDDPFYSDDFQRARMDALTMEHLHQSPYVLDAYASCGTSQIVEYSTGGTLYDQIKIARQNGKDHLSPKDKLRIAVQLASGVADLHSLEPNGTTVLTHNDLCCHQFIEIDGVFKLNDFHSSGYIKKNRKTGRVCKDLPKHISEELIKMRAPEDLVDLYEVDEDTQLIHRDKTDVFSLGNVFYYLLTNQWIFEGERNKYARNYLIDGKRSAFPDRFNVTTTTSNNNTADGATKHTLDPAERAIMKAIQTAWTHNPAMRPTAREIADYLGKELRKIVGGKTGSLARVAVPPLPKDHRYTDTDFRKNLNQW
jgi:serine/threonine protein kinase